MERSQGISTPATRRLRTCTEAAGPPLYAQRAFGDCHEPEHLRSPLPRHHLGRKPRACDWLHGGWLPARHCAVRSRSAALAGPRKPGTSKFTTQRKEADEVRILSGVFEGKTTGTPIQLMIENTDQRSQGLWRDRAVVPARSCRHHLSPEIRAAGSIAAAGGLRHAKRRRGWRRAVWRGRCWRHWCRG